MNFLRNYEPRFGIMFFVRHHLREHGGGAVLPAVELTADGRWAAEYRFAREPAP